SRGPTGTNGPSPRGPDATGSEAIPRAERRRDSRATASRGSDRVETLGGVRRALFVALTVGVVIVLFWLVSALDALAIQLLARPEDVGDPLLAEAGRFDRALDVHREHDVLVLALERGATQVASRAVAER